MPTLTQTAGLKLAPLFVQSLVRHYYDKVVKDPDSPRVPLRDEELLYDQVFSITKVCIPMRWCAVHWGDISPVLYAAIHAGCDDVCSRCSRVAITADVLYIPGTQSRNCKALQERGHYPRPGRTSTVLLFH
jgi:hypothetical protein